VIKSHQGSVATRRNDLIEARYRLTVQEQRVMLWVISQIQPTDDDFFVHRIEVKELASAAGLEGKNIYERMKATTKKLMGRVIELEKQGKEYQLPMINRAIYNKGEGTVDIRLDETLKEYLLQLKDNFTSVRLGFAFKLASTHALRIYELLAQYRKLGERTISLDNIKRMLDVESKYSDWGNFERRVIKTAQREIQEKTDIRFTYEKLKKGRKIDAIRFFIESNDETEVLSPPELPPKSPTFPRSEQMPRLQQHGVSARTQASWEKSYTPAQLTTALDALDAALARGTTIKNRAGWLRRALQEGWTDEQANQRREKRQQDAKAAADRQRERAESERKSASRHASREQLKQLIESLPGDDEQALRQQLKARVIAEIGPLSGIMQGKFKTEAIWISPFVAVQAQAILDEAGLLP